MLYNLLSNPAYDPDIIIAGMAAGFTSADYRALNDYIDRGGAVFLMIETYSPPNVLNFMQRLFQSNVSIEIRETGGAIYSILSQDEATLSGSFGDYIRNLDQDGSPTLYQRYWGRSDQSLFPKVPKF